MALKSKKIILIGHFNVGKTSLIQKFVHSKFSDDYLTTIGVNIEKKSVEINGEDLTMIIWDIAGEVTLERSQQAYLLGAHGIIYVFDLTRESTYQNIEDQMSFLDKKLPNAARIIIGNKCDILPKEEIEKIITSLPITCDYLSSAKTGENVEEMFLHLAKKMV